MNTFLSSNKRKISQYQQWLPGTHFASGPDLREIDSYPEAVAIYKSLDSGPNTIIDDTSLYILARPDLQPQNIRWNEEELFSSDDLDGTPVRAEVWLAVNDGEFITTYRGEVNGLWKKPSIIPVGSDFDIGFTVNGVTMEEWINKGISCYSARFRACENLLSDNYSTRIEINMIKPWTGKWQK